MNRQFAERHEIKYLIGDFAASRLAAKLERVLLRDEHAGASGEYMIRSVYFDDPLDTALQEKLDGVSDRDKYRIRIYGGRDSEIFLERKRKKTDLIIKDTIRITRRAAEKLLDGDPTPLLRGNDPLHADFYAAMHTGILRPRVIVDYAREAFLWPVEHTRVTFDRRIATGLYAHDLFDMDLPTVQVLPAFTQVLEVKYDHYLPDFIPVVLETEHADRMAVSKYTLCREHEGY